MLRVTDWDTTIDVVCTGCDKTLCHAPPKTYSRGNDETNLQEVYHSLVSGTGGAGLKKKMGFMGRESISDASYTRHSDFLFQKMNIYFTDKMKRGHEAIRKHYINNSIAEPDENGVVNIDVSFDGTWLTRGHQSHIGVGFIIEVCTGIIVDFEVLRNHCKVCEIDKSRKHRCHKNFDGKAGAMETEEAK